MDDANEELSKRLHYILDVVGVSEYNRTKYWESAMLHEITETFRSLTYDEPSEQRAYYRFGSLCEGSRTPESGSDLDIVQVQENEPVVDNLSESKQKGRSYFILTDEEMKPGYVRLQMVLDQVLVNFPLDFINGRVFADSIGRVIVKHVAIADGPTSYRSGPALTITSDDGCPVDNVYALRCRQIPKSADSWLHRTRNYDWPSKEQLRRMRSYGCLFVGVGHPQSDNKSCEWRISFSLQERNLMSSLNETQHKCYVLLKMIKTDLIQSQAGESISSYHCKTSLFYTIENSQRHFWTNDKLILCVQQCLKRLFIWVKVRNCPNYFIPEANLFDKLNEVTLKKIEYVLNGILKNIIKSLYSLTTDNVGELLTSKLWGEELCCQDSTRITFDSRYVVLIFITTNIYRLRNQLLRPMSLRSNTIIGYMNELMQLLVYLQNRNHVTEHTKRDVRMALDSIIPHIRLQYNQCVFAQYLSQGNIFDQQSMTIPNIISDASDVDLISSELSLASLYFKSERLQKCKHILDSCEKSLEPPCILSVCNCGSRERYCNLALAKQVRCTDMSSKYFRAHYTTGCMVFHPSQVGLVHPALHYEKFRNVFTHPPCSDYEKGRDYWLNWITIDSQVYLYFLQYLLYCKTNHRTYIRPALRNLNRVITTDNNLGHKETGLNLLGCIFLQAKNLQQAWRNFCWSWQTKPFTNAAKWHMLLLLRESIKGN